MIPSIPAPLWSRLLWRGLIALFLLYLAIPLGVAAAFAFNDSGFPALPWNGVTLDWFLSAEEPRIGLFADRKIMAGVQTSALVATAVTALSLLIGTANAFLFVRHDWPGKGLCHLLMLAPLVIPGVILGISILVFASTIANAANARLGIELAPLRPGLFLVILGQTSFMGTIATLVISARLRRFDRSLEEAALNLGASPAAVLATITLPYLRPALIGAGLVAFLISFENFNTTLMLSGSDAPLTIAMFDRMKAGSTPVLNAASVFLMVGSGLLALLAILFQREGQR